MSMNMNAKAIAKRIAKQRGISRSQRGSVLVMVVGVLAMVSLIVLVYSTVGQADRRAATAVTKRNALSDQGTVVKDYLAKVIGDSTFNYALSTDVMGKTRAQRQMFDYPYTDPAMRSTSTITLPNDNAAEMSARQFKNTGQVNGLFNAQAAVAGTPFVDPRTSGGGKPWLSFDSAFWIARLGEATPANINRPSENFKDTLHLSNFAPSGNFVNLVMLRRDPAVAGSGFNVPSGIGAGKFTNLLSLRDSNGNVVNTRADGVNVSNPDELNRPFNWDTMQRGLIGIADLMGMLPNNPNARDNQFADVDGDGVPDARWFELVDVSDVNNPAPVLGLDPSYRWVFAAKAVDLSGRVNVNTAIMANHFTNNGGTVQALIGSATPNLFTPIGLTPAEIDLQGLLCYANSWAFDPSSMSSPNGYLPPGAVYAGQPAGADAYTAGNFNEAISREVGTAAFAALMEVRLTGKMPASTRTFAMGELPTQNSTRGLTFTPVPPTVPPTILPMPQFRTQYIASRDTDGAGMLASFRIGGPVQEFGPSPFSTAPFGMGDLVELLTYNGANDPASTSRLEAALGGRTNDANLRALDPLRSNRSAEAELAPRNPGAQGQNIRSQAYSDIRRALTTVSGARPLVSRFMALDLTNPVQTTKDLAALDALSAADVRTDITNLIDIALMVKPLDLGATDPANNNAPIANNNQGFTLLRTKQHLAANQILKGYCDALMPLSDAVSGTRTAWDKNDSTFPSSLRTYAYGMRFVPAEDASTTTPVNSWVSLRANNLELSLRTAAHMTVNLLAARDVEKRAIPTVVTADNNGVRVVNINSLFPADEVTGATVIFDINALNGTGTGLSTATAAAGGIGNTVLDATKLDHPSSTGPAPTVRLFPFAQVNEGQLERSLPYQSGNGSTLAGDLSAFRRGFLLNLDAQNPPNTPSRLAPGKDLTNDPDAPVTARALNIYAIKPQPFITAAQSIIVYSDAPATAGGDADFRTLPNSSQPDPDFPPTIRGDIVARNSDFIMQIIVVQFTNPFDTEINLTRDHPDQDLRQDSTFKHYIEFGGRYYRVANRDSSGQRTDVILPPHTTKNFLITSQPIDRMRARWNRIDPSTTGTEFADWIFLQTGVRVSATTNPGADEDAPLEPFDPRSGETDRGYISGTIVDLFASRGLGGELPEEVEWEKNRQVRLWRAYREVAPNPAAGQSESASTGAVNSLVNDILVDRIRDAENTEQPTLDVRLPTGQNDVQGAVAGPEGDQNADNRGLSIAMWGLIRRPFDNQSAGIGGLPSYCIEAKSTLKRAPGYQKSRNTAEQLKPLGSGRSRDVQIGWFRTGTGSNAGKATLKLLRGVSVAVDDRIKKVLNANGGGESTAFKVGATDDPNQRLFHDSVPQRWFSPTLTWRQSPTNPNVVIAPPVQAPLRLTDLLLPMGVGPRQDPLRQLKATDLPNDRSFVAHPQVLSDALHPFHAEVQWTTLSEALALAMDCDSPHSEYDPDYMLGHPTAGALDQGRLALDRFVPFHDYDRGSNHAEFNQTVDLNAKDVSMGIPFGLDVLNQFRTSTDGSVNSMISGLVNINTAPMSVLRTLPLVFPDKAGWMAGTGVYAKANEGFDVAATIRAYRDKDREFARPRESLLTPVPIDMRDGNDGNTAFATRNLQPFTETGRRMATGIGAVRETPGVSSIGEIGAMRIAKLDPNNPNPILPTDLTPAQRADASMDRLGRRTEMGLGGLVSTAGLTSTAYDGNENDPQTVSFATGQQSTGYEQKLALTGAVLGSATVRSDVYAVWFTMQGYRPEDCENLSPEDPLTPSIQKRYVMVVDRSNVTQKGQAPRILMFQELPMK